VPDACRLQLYVYRCIVCDCAYYTYCCIVYAIVCFALYRLRNSWRCSFDKRTEELYCADVGQEAVEEVNIVSFNIY
jgi:hypothetical protein